VINNVAVESETHFRKKVLIDNVLQDFQYENIENIPRVENIIKTKHLDDFLLVVDHSQISEHECAHEDICKYSVFGLGEKGAIEYIDEFPFWNNSKHQRFPESHSEFLAARYLFIKKEYVDSTFEHIKWKESSQFRSERTPEMINVLTKLFNPLGEEAVFEEEWLLYSIPFLVQTKNCEDSILKAHEFTFKQFNGIVQNIADYLTVQAYQSKSHNPMDCYIMENHRKATYALKNLNSLMHKLF
jgi:hypothetical protein